MSVKYVFVTGGVVSGLGKGITAASLGRLLKARGYQVTMQKFDPYINIDPGTMNPIQHGEVFVTDDGTETDLDLGHYERFIDESLDKNSNVTTGKIYWSVLQKERHGDFGGGTVQVIPHITNEIKSRFYRAKSSSEERIAIIEVGGTVGDIESQPFLESIRQFQHDVGHDNAILIHVTLIPYLKASEEMKTKPTQASVKELQGMGIQPDVLVCRSEHPLTDEIKSKIALFCNVPVSHVLQNLDVEYLYEAPLAMEREKLADVVLESLRLENRKPDQVLYCWHPHIPAHDGQILRSPSAFQGRCQGTEFCEHGHTVLPGSFLRYLCFQILPEPGYHPPCEASDPDFSHLIPRNLPRSVLPLLCRKCHHASVLLQHLSKRHAAACIFLPWQCLLWLPDFSDH